MTDMLMCMRTTIRMEPDLLRAAKKLAADTHRTLTAVIEDAVREVVARRDASRPVVALPISTRRGGAMPGVDLIKTSELLDPWEKHRDPS